MKGTGVVTITIPRGSGASIKVTCSACLNKRARGGAAEFKASRLLDMYEWKARHQKHGKVIERES
jgi:hypothetical protein